MATVLNSFNYSWAVMSPDGGDTGQARAHDAIGWSSLPVGGGGTYAREFVWPGPFGGAHTLGCVTAAHDPLADPLTPGNRYAIGADAALATSLATSWIGVGAKIGSHYGNSNLPRGYWLVMGTPSDATGGAAPDLRLLVNRSGTTVELASVHAVALQTWYRFKLELIEGVNEDIIQVYSHNGTTYVLEDTAVILNTSSNYIPWATYQQDKIGVGAGQSTPSFTYFDNLAYLRS